MSIERWSRRTFGILEIRVLLWDSRGTNCFWLQADTTESVLESILQRHNYSWYFFGNVKLFFSGAQLKNSAECFHFESLNIFACFRKLHQLVSWRLRESPLTSFKEFI